MKTEQILMCVVALVLGMLLFHMLKNVCGCNNLIEGQSCNFLMGDPGLTPSQDAGLICTFNNPDLITSGPDDTCKTLCDPRFWETGSRDVMPDEGTMGQCNGFCCLKVSKQAGTGFVRGHDDINACINRTNENGDQITLVNENGTLHAGTRCQHVDRINQKVSRMASGTGVTAFRAAYDRSTVCPSPPGTTEATGPVYEIDVVDATMPDEYSFDNACNLLENGITPPGRSEPDVVNNLEFCLPSDSGECNWNNISKDMCSNITPGERVIQLSDPMALEVINRLSQEGSR